VRFYCDPNEPVAIQTITETSTCEYVLRVRTRQLCTHPQFAVPQPTIAEIACTPVQHSVPTSTNK